MLYFEEPSTAIYNWSAETNPPIGSVALETPVCRFSDFFFEVALDPLTNDRVPTAMQIIRAIVNLVFIIFWF